MERITALEYLQVTRFQHQPLNPIRPVLQHSLHRVKAFVGRGSQVRYIFEIAARRAILDRQCHGVIVGVEMPGKAIAVVDHVDDHICKRIVVTEKPGFRLAKCGADKGHESGPLVDGAQRAVGTEIIGRDEGVRAVIEPIDRVIVRQPRVRLREIRVGAAAAGVALMRDAVGFGDQSGQPGRRDKAFQHRAASGLNIRAQTGDQVTKCRTLGPTDWKACQVDQVACVHSFRLRIFQRHETPSATRRSRTTVTRFIDRKAGI